MCVWEPSTPSSSKNYGIIQCVLVADVGGDGLVTVPRDVARNWWRAREPERWTRLEGAEPRRILPFQKKGKGPEKGKGEAGD